MAYIFFVYLFEWRHFRFLEERATTEVVIERCSVLNVRKDKVVVSIVATRINKESGTDATMKNDLRRI
jgi:hypothetical protein